VKFFTAAKLMGIHTALDTNGMLCDRISDSELENIDLVLLDIKSWDKDRHIRVTGMDNEPVLSFARRLSNRKKPIWLRFVLVPGLTDDAGDVSNIAKFANDLGNVKRVDVLPFHQMGKFKWIELKLNYTLERVKPPSPESIEQICALFQAEGLKVY
jgi:pyruvate formate lyase activating enzyme